MAQQGTVLALKEHHSNGEDSKQLFIIIYNNACLHSQKQCMSQGGLASITKSANFQCLHLVKVHFSLTQSLMCTCLVKWLSSKG